jgi:hypothetical protein
MILSLMKCRICGKTISPPDQTLIIGESAPARNQRILQSLFSHIQGKMQSEQNQADQPHTAALIAAMTAGENLKGALLIGNFEISPEQEAERQDVLRRVHEITRTVRVSDEELQQAFRRATMSIGTGPLYGSHWEFCKDLRDRYEGLGKYAPKAATQPEPVKA